MEIINKYITAEDIKHYDAEEFQGMTVAVHLHLFYEDLLTKFCFYLNNIHVKYDLYISTPDIANIEEEKIKEKVRTLTHLGKLTIVRTPNRGRDIGPLICTFGKDLSQYDVILHLHTKKSKHNKKSGEAWCSHMLNHLLFSKDMVFNILHVLQNDVAFVCSSDYIIDTSSSHWGKNKKKAKELIERCKVNLDIDKDYPIVEFPAGMFFWARGDNMRKMLTLPLQYDDFPEEPIPDDGTIAHALERLTFILGDDDAYKVLKISLTDTDIIEKMKIKAMKNAKHLHMMQVLVWTNVVLVLIILILLLLLFR